MRRTSVARATLVAAVLTLLAACGDEDPAPPPELGGESSPSDPGTPSSSAADDGPANGTVAWRDSAESGGEETAAADVWRAYWDELMRMYTTLEVDRDRLYELSTGNAASLPLDYTADMTDRDVHLEGGMEGWLNGVRVKGSTATIETCFRSTAVEVDQRGKPAEPLEPFLAIRGKLEKEGPDWRVIRSLNLDQAVCDMGES